jgi:hypothetical protein
MEVIEFIKNICQPHVKVSLNLLILSRDEDISVTYEKFSRDQIGNFQTPWYTDVNGNGSEYDIEGSVSIKVKETLKKLDPRYLSHIEHINRIEYFRNRLSSERLFVYAPILPIVGYDGDKTYFIFDGTHRLSAYYFINELQEVLVMMVKSKNLKYISEDFRYHS